MIACQLKTMTSSCFTTYKRNGNFPRIVVAFRLSLTSIQMNA